MTITSFIPESLPIIVFEGDQNFIQQLAVNNFPEASNWDFTQETHVPEGASLTSSGLLTVKKGLADGNYPIAVQCKLPNGQILKKNY